MNAKELVNHLNQKPLGLRFIKTECQKEQHCWFKILEFHTTMLWLIQAVSSQALAGEVLEEEITVDASTLDIDPSVIQPVEEIDQDHPGQS